MTAIGFVVRSRMLRHRRKLRRGSASSTPYPGPGSVGKEGSGASPMSRVKVPMKLLARAMPSLLKVPFSVKRGFARALEFARCLRR